MTKDDRRAAALLVLLAVAGVGVRLVTGDTAAPGAVGYRAGAGARPSHDSVAARARRLARPLQPGERVDVDRASAGELARLPRIGPGLASRIVGARAAEGPFGSLEALGEVPGIGPRTLELLAPHVTFSARRGRRPVRDGRSPIPVNSATADELVRLPGIGPALAAAIVDERRRNGPFTGADDLRRVRGIGAQTIARLRGRIRVP